MGVMSYEHEMRVLNHELADKDTTIEQQRAELEQLRAELDSLRTLLAKLLAGEKIDPEAALLENHKLAGTLTTEPEQAE